MAKGGAREGAGRKPGTPNRDVALAREAIAKFVDNNTERLQGWLDHIAKENPLAAFNCVRDLIEYHVPKLQRQEVQPLDKNGQPTDPISELRVTFVDNRPTDTNGV